MLARHHPDPRYGTVISGRLFVGDIQVAQCASTLDLLGITHIVACGFEKGFHSPRKYVYRCIDVDDIPRANLLSFLPRATGFIQHALRDGGKVLVHCVYGQSRSCAVCVAYLMREFFTFANDCAELISPTAHHKSLNNFDFNEQHCRSHSILFDHGIHLSYKSLLHDCYSYLLKVRPTMAINPGFMRQLEMFRRMGCGLATQCRPNSLLIGITVTSTMIYSKPHASFRSFRAKSEYHGYHTVKSTFLALPTDKTCFSLENKADQELHPGKTKEPYFRCCSCGLGLFTAYQILDSWTDDDEKNLPSSLYWSSYAGRTANRRDAVSTNLHTWSPTTLASVFAVEPIDWMKSQMVSVDTQQMAESGKLHCPACNAKVGTWDWNHPDYVAAIFILKSKVHDSSKS